MENNLKWMGHTSTIFEMQRDILKEGSYYDVKLVFINGEFLYAHKAILISYSDVFKECLKNIPETSDRETVILLPDIKKNIMLKILEFVYLGEVILNCTDLAEFLESNTFLGIKNSISFECSYQNSFNNTPQRSEESIEITTQTVEIQDKVVSDPISDEIKDDQQQKEFIVSKESEEQTKSNSTVHLKLNTDAEIISSTQDQFTTIEEFEQVTVKDGGDGGESEYIIADNPETYQKSFTYKQEKHSQGLIKIEVSSMPVATTSQQNPSDTTIYKITEDGNVEGGGESSSSQSEYKIYSIETASPTSTKSKGLYGGQKFYTERERNIVLAIRDVLKDRLSLSKAAIKYNISKTVLWRRLRNDPLYKHGRQHPLLSAAHERLGRGESLKSISQSLNIPMSTLHRHKVRLLEQGFFPDTGIQVKRRLEEDKLNTKIKLEQAIKACQMGMTQNKAAQDFGVSKSTLWRHFKRTKASETLDDDQSGDNSKKFDGLEYSTIEYTIEEQDVDQEIVEEEQEYSISEFEDEENKYRSIVS